MGVSCAKQGTPPGGLEDKIAPSLLSSVPAQNATNVPRTESIVFVFSETMGEESVEDNLFIVPIPLLWPSCEWSSRGKVLTLRLKEPLRQNTTYVVSVGAKARDHRRNEMDDSIMLCFSTGGVVENKRITGRVIPLDYFGEKTVKVSAVDVIAYRLEDVSSDPDPRNDVPGYFTQTGSDGTYEIMGLSSGLYRFFTIGDRDNDGFYTEGYDQIGIMSCDIEVAEHDTLLSAPDMTFSEVLTSEVQLLSIKAPDRRRVEFFFDRAVDPSSIEVEIGELELVDWFVPFNRPGVVSFVTSEQENRKRYVIPHIAAGDRDGNPLMALEDRPYFSGTDRPDTTALVIEEWEPKLLSSPDERIRLVFNRILAFPDDTLGLIEADSGERVQVTRLGPNILELAPLDRWQYDMNYRIVLDRETLKGSTGSSLTEGGAELRFRMVPADTLGTINGVLEDRNENPDAVYRLVYENLDTETMGELVVEHPGKWTTGSVMPGNYRLLAHRDSDRDGNIFRGTISPYHAAEQVVAYTDTLVVEPRWPVEDIAIVFR